MTSSLHLSEAGPWPAKPAAITVDQLRAILADTPAVRIKRDAYANDAVVTWFLPDGRHAVFVGPSGRVAALLGPPAGTGHPALPETPKKAPPVDPETGEVLDLPQPKP